ncbi:MAG: class I SAM-dependent methyltransferase [Candidatus Bathyarchaeia archaeon]|jgi:ubiquinone/menaquinone biosynthesis C-methylase UbiE
MSELVDYYRQRAKEYEDVYYGTDPHRQEEQALMANTMKTSLAKRDVLDIACGTGWWDRILSETAKSITGLDINRDVLKIAKTKEYMCTTRFQVGDAYEPPYQSASFDGALATFWLSHIPKAKLHGWIDTLHKVLKPGSKIFIADNTNIPGIGGPLVTKEGDENTYKLRTLKDGSQHMVLKNYYSTSELIDIFGRHVEGFSEGNTFHGHCFYWVDYEI